jgi:cardiolipin-specific phospholipase
MFFLSSWKYTAEKLKEAEAVLFQLASRYGDRSPESYRMELFDTEIPSSAVPLKGLRDKTLVIHGVQLDALDIDHDNDHDHDHDHKNAKLSKYPLVLLHGYMNGALYYYRNLVGLTKYFSTVYLLDSLGWGRSSRPTFHPLDDSVRATEAVFVESLEAWRHAHDIDKMVLAGHSMGGYLSIAYCEAYPERVERLILISPVGVPVDDKATTRTLSWTTWALTQLYHTFHVTPCTILRSLPEGRGKAYVQGYIEHRLSPAISDPYEQMALTNYLYYNAISNGSGEYAVQRLLTPFAFAKEPTIHRDSILDCESYILLVRDTGLDGCQWRIASSDGMSSSSSYYYYCYYCYYCYFQEYD